MCLHFAYKSPKKMMIRKRQKYWFQSIQTMYVHWISIFCFLRVAMSFQVFFYRFSCWTYMCVEKQFAYYLLLQITFTSFKMKRIERMWNFHFKMLMKCGKCLLMMKRWVHIYNSTLIPTTGKWINAANAISITDTSIKRFGQNETEPLRMPMQKRWIGDF